MSDCSFPPIDYLASEEPEIKYKINRELNLAQRIIEETGSNLFLTGKAGTGKTTFLRNLREKSHKRMVVLAPTGVAAINAQGQTIHSFFQFPFSPYVIGKGFISEPKQYSFNKSKRKLIRNLDLLVIDEISMVRPDILDAIDESLRRVRGNQLPFGGLQLLLIGDLRQLAPVIRENEWQYLQHLYNSSYFFESKALQQAGMLTIELTHIYRQTDLDFIQILNAVRDGIADQKTLDKLNARYRPDSEDDDEYIRLTTHNVQADATNNLKLSRLPGSTQKFDASIVGNFPKSSYPADTTLLLKKGARVMFIKNDTGEDRRFYNGMLGSIIKLSKDEIIVRPDDNSDPITVEYATWENIKYVINDKTGELQEVVDGTFTQIPLRLAWSITIHKSQGLTFSKAIIDAQNSFAPGQAYVALSRCKSLEGLFLNSLLSPRAIIIDQQVNNFINQCRERVPDEEVIERCKDQYFRSVIRDIFDFNTLKLLFENFSKVVQEFIAPIQPALFTAYNETQNTLRKKITDVGNSFGRKYSSVPFEVSENSDELRSKIRNGCAYFLNELKPIILLLRSTPLKLDNKKYQTQVKNAFEPLSECLTLKFHLLSEFANTEFSLFNYLSSKAKVQLNIDNGENIISNQTSKKTAKKEKGKNSKSKESANTLNAEISDINTTSSLDTDNDISISAELESTKKRKKQKPKGYSKYESFKMAKEGMSIVEIAEKRGLVVSTITSHLGDFFATGELKLEDYISHTDLDIMTVAFKESFVEENGIIKPKASIFFEIIQNRVEGWASSLFWHTNKPR